MSARLISALHKSLGLEAIKDIIAEGEEINNPVAHLRFTSEGHPLTVAAFTNSLGAVKVLIEAGANVDISSHGATSGYRTPLCWAIFHRNLEMINVLIDAGSPLARDDKEFFPTYAKSGLLGHNEEVSKIEVLKLLVERGAPLNGKENPLHLAASINNLQAIELLVAAGADPEYVTSFKKIIKKGKQKKQRTYHMTPLEWGVFCGRDGVAIQAAIDRGLEKRSAKRTQPAQSNRSGGDLNTSSKRQKKASAMWSEQELQGMTRPELQRLAKERGIRANTKKTQIIEDLLMWAAAE